MLWAVLSTRLLVLATLSFSAACGSESEPAPSYKATTLAAPAPTAAAPTSPPKPTIAPGMGGACRDKPRVANVEDRDQPAAIAFCPDPTSMSRGNGMPPDHEPQAPTTKPPWDTEAVTDYACAYACATSKAQAYLLAYIGTAEQHRAAFLIEHGSDEAAPKWSIVVMYKRTFNRWWNIDSHPHSRTQPVVVLPRRPTPAEVEHVLAIDGLTGATGATNVDDNWKLVLGGLPSH